MERERRITVRAPESLHKTVRVKAAELGRPVSEVVRALLEMWTEGKIELPDPEQGSNREDTG